MYICCSDGAIIDTNSDFKQRNQEPQNESTPSPDTLLQEEADDVDWSGIGSITFDCKYSRIRIYKSLIRAMGNPAYIVILINKEDRQIALLGKAEEVEDSFKVPVELMNDPAKSFVLHGRWFTLKMMHLMGWRKHSYRVSCGAMLDKVVPVFYLDEAVQINDDIAEQ